MNRPGFVKVKYKGLDNKDALLTAAEGYAALVVQEIDHLNGMLYIDHHQKAVNQNI